MRIVVAVDESRQSQRAVEFVTQMRWPAGSRMLVVTVVPPAVVPMEAPVGFLPPEVEDARVRCLESIVRKAEDLLRAAGFSVEGRVIVGDPSMELMNVTHEERADLLVMGSHGRKAVARLLLGSVSHHSVTHAPCSVLVVKDTAHPGARLETTSVEHETLGTPARERGVN